tara:strand:- start:181 stop:1029 length:849 start_codon:yes stop_codon:yes gene_type:complete
MSFNKYKIKIDKTVGGKFLKIPLSLDFSSVDQSEVVNRDFVDGEVEKSINPILDYEKVRFLPLQSNGIVVKDLVYNLSFLDDNNSLIQPTHYSDIGFVDDDIKFKKNRFTKSFLRLNFYDDDKTTNQNFVLSITIFNRLNDNDYSQMVDGNGTPSLLGGLSNPPNIIPVRFTLKNPIIEPEGFAEGFYLYHFKSGFKKGAEPAKLFMRAEFNNAATGKITRFIATNETLPINQLINKLHVGYLLTRTATGFYYSIDTNYNDASNVVEDGTNLTVNLYEIKVI